MNMQVTNIFADNTALVGLVATRPERSLLWKSRLSKYCDDHLKVLTPDDAVDLARGGEMTACIVDDLDVLIKLRAASAMSVLMVIDEDAPSRATHAKDLDATDCILQAAGYDEMSLRLEAAMRQGTAPARGRLISPAMLQDFSERLAQAGDRTFARITLSADPQQSSWSHFDHRAFAEAQNALVRRICQHLPKNVKGACLGQGQFQFLLGGSLINDAGVIAEQMVNVVQYPGLRIPSRADTIDLNVQIRMSTPRHLARQAETADELINDNAPLAGIDHSALNVIRRRAALMDAA